MDILSVDYSAALMVGYWVASWVEMMVVTMDTYLVVHLVDSKAA